MPSSDISWLIWLPLLLVAVITSYRSVPGLLQGLQNQAPFEFNALGCPDEEHIFARLPNRVQTQFLWFVLSGRAYAVTSGGARTSAVFAWLGYVVTAVALLGLLIDVMRAA